MDYIFLLIFIILQLILLSSVFKADSEIDENLLLSAFHSKRGQKTTKISYENIKNNTVLEADSRDYTKSKAASKETIIEHNEGIKAKSDFTSFLKSLQIDITSSLNTFEDKDLNITLSLNDIRKLMYEGIVDEYQALLLWEFAIEMTSEPNFKNKITSSILKRFTKNSAADMYLLNFIHIKSFFVFLTTVVVFLVLYKYLQRIQKSGRMNIRIGVIFLAISLYYSYVLYNWMYYISSNIIFIFFCLCLKYTIEIFVSRTYKLKKEDIDITKESDNDKMFNYKLSIILICGIIMVFLIVTKFNSLFNYIILYGILLKFFNLLTLRIQAYFPDELQPVSDLIFFFIGFGNFLITNIYRNNKDLNSIYDLPDSCYIISEIFTFITITSIFSYVKIQSFDWTSAELNENAKVKTREFTISDILWLLLFIIGFIIFFLSLRYNNYVSFIFGLHYFKHLFKLLNDIFKIKVIRVLFCLYLIILFMCLCILTSSTDIRLCVLFDIYNETFISISKFLLKVITLFYTVWIIKLVDKIIFINHEEDDSHITDNNGEVKKVEIRSEKISKKERVIKIQWYTCDANKLSLSIYDYIYVLSDMISNYLLIVYFLYMIKFLESSLFFKCLYCVVLITFLTRFNLLINEYKEKSIFFVRLLSHILLIRLLLLCNENKIFLYNFICLFILILIFSYCVAYKKTFFTTVFYIYTSLSSAIVIQSGFLTVLFLILIVLPIFFYNKDIRVYKATFTSFFIPTSIIVFFQMIGYKTILSYIAEVNNDLGFDVFYMSKSSFLSLALNEFDLISLILKLSS